ncbi:MAG: PAS domain S-box protein [Mariprofundaceae bacterium]|nr:PAS domain S-box protein [Mariprofundaceae bacterium]
MKKNKIQHIMSTDVITASPDCLLKHAVVTMQQQHVVFLVITLDNKPIGILTERDIVRFASEHIDPDLMAVKHVMSCPVMTVSAQANLFTAYEVLSQHKVSHIIVVKDNGCLAGVLTRTHILGGLSIEHFIELKQVEDVMNQHVSFLYGQDTVDQALHAMTEQDSSCVIILRDEQAHGIITEQDIMQLYAQGIKKHTALEDIMSHPVCTIDQQTFIPKARAMMQEKKFRHLVVVDQHKKMIGIISQSNIEQRIEDSYIAFLQALIKQQSQSKKDEYDQFSTLFSQNPNAVFNHHLDGTITMLNSACLALTGFSEQQLISKRADIFIHPQDVHHAMESFNKAIEGKSGHAEFRVLRPAGEVIHVFNSYHPIYIDQKLYRIFSIMHDITEKKEAQQKVKKAEEQAHLLALAMEQAGDSVTITDATGTIKFVNAAFTRITGYAPEEALGKKPSILKSGEQDDAFYRNMWHTITRGRTWNSRLVDRRKNGAFFPAELTISPVKNDHDVITHFIGIKRDLTEREELDGRFRQAQKMEAIGTLVGGIAHDFNNMLAGITGNIYLARHQLNDPSKVLERLDDIEALSFRAADMIQQLLMFARKSSVCMKKTPLKPLLKELFKLLKTSVPENIQLTQDVCHDMLYIHGDATQIHQILMNLINNARDAVACTPMPMISIKLHPCYIDAITAKNKHDFNEGHYAHLSIQDNGMGIETKNLEHLFEPFFTTKEQGKGTGLGLSMVFGAVKSHQGLIEVESTKGKGSVFHLYFPLLQPQSTTSIDTPHTPICRGKGERILLVDDEQSLLETTSAVLQSFNYQLLEAKDGVEALAVFRQEKNIDLIVSDVVMPRCGGLELAKKIRAMGDDTPIILMTGYDTTNVLNANDAPLENTSVLHKPMPFEALSQHIKKVLTEARITS